MGWLSVCHDSKAKGRYQRRVFATTGVYLVLLFGAFELVKRVQLQGAGLYALAMVPAVPVILLLVWLGLYLQEETDEYLRLMMVRSLMAGTAALLGLIVVSDFLRVIAERPALPPFTCFVVFFLSFGIAQWVQKLRNRGGGDA